MHNDWETVIGLEIHVQLATRSKIFSGAATRFGAAPNTQACAVDLAMPGTLPVLNAEALTMAVKFGLAIDADIARVSVFDRKNYFYPDLPKGYQISQLDYPIVGAGAVTIELPDGSSKRIAVTRAHLEEDAGKSLHEDFHGATGIDLNRAGTPLLEIVSEPEMRNAQEAVAYLRQIHSIVRYLGISDGNMAEGSLRCDVNLSLRKPGSDTLGTRTEIKNLNSFRFVEKAIEVERLRQAELLESGASVAQETRLYDPVRNETRPMRSKEVAHDYRYFPEPDLLPVHIDDAFIEQVRARLPELPAQKVQRFRSSYGLTAYDASVLSASRELADYFEQVTQGAGDAKISANWVMVELLGQLNREGLEVGASRVSAPALGALIARILDGTISGRIAKTVFEAMWAGEGEADQIIDARGLRQLDDSSAIEALVDKALADNAGPVARYRATDPDKRVKLFGFFVGQVMKASMGKANPQQVNELLRRKLDGE
ncbi:MAG: Asp-tRNA(Asn)/Glu-tRNA(Gln) amidotransferase subunit GatB [Gammaproteobacteria bacterium]|jgi:aspartyl-tRNA(Asn)/glutamyl-tRNA(Gln) amidotransferase subunit B|nr:Asp-tRNA(Asn)/Glu-tRNA(Gln) amidotransferase subunit GatB [Gammaproteobacteria bacterium]MBP6051735.1 Asp-tRNA(Asn)/Glu-tRNA(Gln) amidotransferase subunit GatB [Pseudomonadales bacterium]MBK7171078.1 Asp-tRNA(Asn)/Glu-tRNA(Gln) amidotransferase subunit GatB [Gammaproteobacteria bacterium]MBK7519747.1 Asp-tRNA(Asn)/Glu-tRNA(Gln) amidotransferase subunit GatB [Gammaproteobacteria bacterium]MBK7731006.1 Asp-tRNA(Asn)/Glu-tRNA(Gln) amidotransferase subunit GatB [Gammaproteobacteria bacterium]